jgi:hypothetical protein
MNLETVTALTADECWQLLRRHDVARLFYRVGDLTHLAVVNHAVVGGTVSFRTVDGSDVLSSVLGREVTLELDEHHELGSRCVVVRGVALRVDEPGGREADVEILPISISGRRLHDGRLPATA